MLYIMFLLKNQYENLKFPINGNTCERACKGPNSFPDTLLFLPVDRTVRRDLYVQVYHKLRIYRHFAITKKETIYSYISDRTCFLDTSRNI